MSYVGEERRKSHLDLNDRLVIVETKLETLNEIEKTLKTLTLELAKYRGMVGMAIWVGGAIITVFSLFKDNLLKIFGK